MSISLSALVSIRPFRGYVDPGLPTGYWSFFGSVLGDGSGGLMSVFVRMQIASSPNPSQYYSLEQLMVRQTSDAVDVPARLSVANMDPQPDVGSTGALQDTYNLPLFFDLSGFNGASLRLSDSPTPLFIGHPIDNNLASGLNFDHGNVNAASLVIRAQGYFWEPGAINASNGLRRPVDGMYAR